MTIKSLVSPLALAAAATLALSSASFAQTTVGDQQISDEDLPAVTEHCTMLADEGAAAGDAAGADAAGAAGAEADAAAAADANAGATADNGADGAADAGAAEADAGAEAGTTLDLEAITLEDCRAAGLVE